MKNIVTYTFDYTCDEDGAKIINTYINQYNNLLRCCYKFGANRTFTTKEMWEYQTTLNNVVVECGLRNGVIYQVKQINKAQDEAFKSVNNKRKKNKTFQRQKNREICFGGKKLFTSYQKGLISKEEFEKQRNFPIYSVGEKKEKANRHFRIKDLTTLMFQPTKDIHIPLKIKANKQRQKDLQKLFELQENKQISITWQLDYNKVHVTFDLNQVRQKTSSKAIDNRIMAIDMNPNYIGFTVTQWTGELDYKILHSGTISIEELTNYENNLKGKHIASSDPRRKYVYNKRDYEICLVARNLVNIAKHYHCEMFAFEDLSIDSQDTNKGKKINRLCNNQWNRNKLVEQIKKHCMLNEIQIREVKPAYSSFIGNMGYRQEKLPDMCLASLEIARRGYEFNLQHVKKVKEKKKNIVLPEIGLFQKRIEQALEEIGYIVKFSGLRELYYLIKNSKVKYRVPLSESRMVSRLFSHKSCINLYSFR